MNILKKKRNLLITLCIAAMLICSAVLFGAAALPGDKNTAYAATEGTDCAVLTYLDNGDNTCSVSGIDKTNEYNNTNSNKLKIVIPATHDGKNVTAIGNKAFYNTSFTVTSVDFSNAANLTTIGQSAFEDCSALVGALIIPESVTKIKSSAFSNCTGLSSLTLGNNVETIDIAAFGRCSGLTGELIIPDSVKFISNGSFSGCEGLSSLTLGNKVEEIGGYAFNGCSGLEGTLVIPDSVKNIWESAFKGCRSLTSLAFGNQVVTIKESAFDNCSSLDGAIVIPDSVSSIGNSVFKFCSALDTVYLPSNSTYGNGVFFNVTGKIVAKDKTQYDSLKMLSKDFANESNFTYETNVTFNANGGTVSGQETLIQQKLFYSSYTFEKNDATKVWVYNSSYKFPTASKLGFKFESYNTQPDGQGQQLNTSSAVEDNKTYYAQYTENPFIFFEITNEPKTTYNALENFDPAGMVITANFKDGSTQEITESDYTVVNGDKLQVGARTVTVSVTIGGITLEKDIGILVKAIQLEKPTLGTGTYTYSGNEQMVTLNGFDANTMNVTGNMGTIAQNYNAVVSLKDTKNYQWMDYSNYDITLSWKIDKANLTVTPSYNADAKVYVGGTLPTITSDQENFGTIKWNSYTLSDAGTKSFNWTWTPSSANYNNVTGNITFDVLAVELESISVSFDQGETKVYTSTDVNTFKNIFLDSLIVTKNFNNGTTETITDSNLYTLSGALTAGTSTVTAMFNGKTATFNVTVTAVELESILASFNQNGAKIYTSSTLDSLKNMLTVTGLNNDGTTYTSAIDYALTGTLSAGTSTVTATFNGKTATFDVTVTAVELASILANFNQGETKIYTSATLDSLKSYLTVTGKNNDGSAYTSAIAYMLEGTLTVGESTITVKFGGKSDTFHVTVTVLESLAITTNPNKTVYMAFENFDKTGMVVTATFSHGTETISNFSVTKGDNLQVGTTSLTISYTSGGITKTAAVSITVNKILLEKPTASGKYTYNGSAQVVTLDGFDANTMSITGNMETNASTYDVVVTLSDTTNYGWKDNTIIDITLNWAIEKASYNMSGISFTDKTVKENGNGHTLILNGTLPNGVTVTYTGTNGYVQGGVSLAGIYEITATFAVTDNYNLPQPLTATLTVNLAEITGTDNSSGSTVIITDGGNGIKPGTTVTVKEKPAADYKDTDITLADKKQTVLQANDIALVYNGVTIRPEGTLTVRMFINENLRGYENLKVVYIAPDGTIQDMNASRDGDYMTFSTGHFSLYAIVAPNNEKTVTSGNGLSVGVIACIVVASVLVVLMLILLILFLLRKDKSQGFKAYCVGLFKKGGKNAKNKNIDVNGGDEVIEINVEEATKPDDDFKE